MCAAKFFFFLIIFSYMITSKPPIEELIKHNKPYSAHKLYYLSPLHGAVGAEGDYLKKIWLSPENKSSTQKLLKSLFIVEEGDEFLATTYQPYCRFTPSTMSMLVAQAYDKTLFKKEATNDYHSLKKLTQTFEGPKNPKKIQALIELIEKSLHEEDNNLFNPGTTFQILLAFLYLQSDTNNDLQLYNDKIFHYLDLETVSKVPNETCQLSLEQLMAQKIMEKVIVPYRPPTLYWRRGVIYKNYKPISNCCEAAIREIVNFLAYDPHTQEFNCARLPTKLSPALTQFYSMHRSAKKYDDVNAMQIHENWMDVVCQLPDVEYRKEKHEIDPSLINIMHCITTICGVTISKNQYLSQKKYVKKICKLLSNPKFYRIRATTIALDKQKAADILFTLKYIDDNETHIHNFELHIRKNHAWIKHILPTITRLSLIKEELACESSLDSLVVKQIKEELQQTHLHPALNDLATLYLE